MRAAIYARISRDRHGAGLGVGRQLDDCRALCEQLGYTVVVEHTDNDLSAYSGKPRPGYLHLLDDVRAGHVDAVVAWHTDRLHRSPSELEAYIAACDMHGVPTHTVTAGHLDLATPSGRLVARQLGAVARYEVEHMIERQKRAKLGAATAGNWKGGRRPFGYESDGYTVRDSEAAVILAGSHDILRGVSVNSLTAQWNRSGILTTTGREWIQVSVRRVIMRPRNAGLMEHRGEILGPANWPAIVPEVLWRGVAAILGDPARRTQMSSARRWQGSHLYICGVCGRADMSVVLVGPGERYHAYTCSPVKHIGRIAAGVDQLVDAVVVERLSRPDAVHLLDPPTVDGAAAAAVEAASLRAQLDEAASLYAKKMVTGGQLATITAELTTQIEAAEKRMVAASHGSLFGGLVGVPDVAGAWREAHIDRRRRVIDALMTVTILPTQKGRRHGWKTGERYFDPDSVRIDWK